MMSGQYLKMGVAIFIVVFIPAIGWCGEIFGSVIKGDRAASARVEVKCGSTPYGPVDTDNFGSYRLFVRERGPCTLTVTYQGQTLPSMEITSYERPMRYDLEIRGNSLQRR